MLFVVEPAMLVLTAATLAAAEAAPTEEAAPELSLWSFLPLILGMFLVMYFFSIRPQFQREREERELQQRVKKNDHVVTKCGMHGVVMNAKDDEVVLRVDEQQNVKVRFLRSAIARIVSREDEARAKDAGKDAKDQKDQKDQKKD